ncbi:uncharacterized protein LOC110857917 isoform X1 [Folsomia candida]|uniref:uncharacterized protein LOC110857917 isoform X1 n=1 Tax=Folsomia candida TaxID=158441 RepID=UPI001604E5A1|nr:uncharacterized protein LOC110857917 isoform X1 [Folsomia candida]
MTDEQVETVFGCKTAPEMWDKLSSIYQSTSGENKQALWQKFYLIMADEKSPVKTMIQIQNIASQLRSLGIVIDDVAEVARVISSLAGDKYRQFREAWRSVDISKQSTKFKVDECMKLNSDIVVEKTVIFGTGELTKISEIEDLNCFVVTNETPSFCKPVMNVKDEIIATNITENNVKIPRYKNGKDYQSQRLISFAPEKENMFWLNELHTSHRALKYAINTDILHRPHRTKSTEEAPPEQAVIPVTRRDDTKKSNQRNPGKNKKKRTNARVLIPKNYCKFNAPWSEEFEMLKLFFSIRILVLIRFHGREVFFRREKGTHFRKSNYVLKKHNISEYQPRLVLMQICMQFKGSERATYEFALIVLLLYMHSNASEGISQYLKRRKICEHYLWDWPIQIGKTEKFCPKM